MAGRHHVKVSLLTLLAGTTVGFVVVALERGGVGARPALAGIVLALAVAAGFAPLRYGLPIATVLASLQDVWLQFAGTPGKQWKEVFILILVGRAIWKRERAPSSLAVAGFALGAAWLLIYLLRGSTFLDFAWGMKLLLLFLIFGCALAALQPSEREWWATWNGIAVAVAANFVIALWQMRIGAEGLSALGFEYGRELRLAEGSFRAFGGFLYAAPLGHFMAIAALCWVGMLFSSAPSRALPWIWVPALAGMGLVLSLNRTAVMASVGAVVIVAIRRRRVLAVALVGAVVGITFFTFAGSESQRLLGEGASMNTPSVAARVDIWQRRLADLSLLGDGPGSAGAAVERTNPGALTGDIVTVPNTADLIAQGVVDNQYVAWLYSYGIIGGGLLIGAWMWALIGRLTRQPYAEAAEAAGQLVAAFSIIAAIAANFWEEFPQGFMLALIFVVSIGGARRGPGSSGESTTVNRASADARRAASSRAGDLP